MKNEEELIMKIRKEIRDTRHKINKIDAVLHDLNYQIANKMDSMDLFLLDSQMRNLESLEMLLCARKLHLQEKEED